MSLRRPRSERSPSLRLAHGREFLGVAGRRVASRCDDANAHNPDSHLNGLGKIQSFVSSAQATAPR
jgi:hypothetical protein